jgi:hypothetical protein
MQIKQEFAMRARRRLWTRSRGAGMARWFAITAVLLREMLPRAGDREAFVVEQAFDLENSFDVFAAI